MKLRALLAAGLALCALGQGARALGQGAAQSPDEPFVLVERSDFSRYVDGKYVGHVYRETRGRLAPTGGAEYAGEFLVFEETLRDMRSSARRVDRASPVRLAVAPGGELSVREDSGFPSLRGFPSLPRDPKSGAPVAIADLRQGDSWTSPGKRALDFDDTGDFVLLPFLAEYRYLGMTDYNGRKALSLKAKFATRWNPQLLSSSAAMSAERAAAAVGRSEGADKAPRSVIDLVKNATGTHDLDILIDAESLAPIFIRDRFDESFALARGAAGSSERRSGFSLYFFEGARALDRGAAGGAIVAAVSGGGEALGEAPSARSPSEALGEAPSARSPSEALGGPAGGSPGAGGGGADDGGQVPPGAGAGPLIAGEGSQVADFTDLSSSGAMKAAGLELDSSPEGLVLRVKDLRFVADSDEILRSELGRLDAIAAALKAIPGRSFLVAGHSASVGKASGELELSIRRAKKVTDELAARGIEAGRLLYRGFGSSRPLASNDTEEGRAKNRRVEITILD
jgi:outer membrane protein OmpA-like peptidoglycan-associated protein